MFSQVDEKCLFVVIGNAESILISLIAKKKKTWIQVKSDSTNPFFCCCFCFCFYLGF